jgi:hypothetical protein
MRLLISSNCFILSTWFLSKIVIMTPAIAEEHGWDDHPINERKCVLTYMHMLIMDYNSNVDVSINLSDYTEDSS